MYIIDNNILNETIFSWILDERDLMDEEEISGFELFTLVQWAWRFPLLRNVRALGYISVGWPVAKIMFGKQLSKSGNDYTKKIQFQLI